jgi:hypothetical protein
MSNEHRKNLEDIINLFVKLPLIKNDVGSLEPHSTEILEGLVVKQVIPVTIDIFNIAMSNNLNYTAEIMDIINAIKKDEFSKNHFNNYVDFIGKQIIKENQMEETDEGHKMGETNGKPETKSDDGIQVHQEEQTQESQIEQTDNRSEPFMSERSKKFIENLD